MAALLSYRQKLRKYRLRLSYSQIKSDNLMIRSRHVCLPSFKSMAYSFRVVPSSVVIFGIFLWEMRGRISCDCSLGQWNWCNVSGQRAVFTIFFRFWDITKIAFKTAGNPPTVCSGLMNCLCHTHIFNTILWFLYPVYLVVAGYRKRLRTIGRK